MALQKGYRDYKWSANSKCCACARVIAEVEEEEEEAKEMAGDERGREGVCWMDKGSGTT